MPTPFTHLRVASRLLRDEVVPVVARDLLTAEVSAFLLGNIAADARVSSGINREDTHFYAYDRPVTERPWRLMLRRYPVLGQASDPPQRAFLAGYVAHLAMDEVWSLEMIRPHFAAREWASRDQRFLMHNLLLVWMDQRDYACLENWQRNALLAAKPDRWAPFISDFDLAAWRDFVGQQLPPEGRSRTLEVVGERVGLTPDALQTRLGSEEGMEAGLWTHVPQKLLAEVEAMMYAQARADMLLFLNSRNRETNAPEDVE